MANYSSDYVPTGNPRPCCVADCKNRHSKRHRFPKSEPDIFNKWLERIQPHSYEVLSPDQIYYKYVVCEEHFVPNDIVPGTRRGFECQISEEAMISESDKRMKLTDEAAPASSCVLSALPQDDDIPRFSVSQEKGTPVEKVTAEPIPGTSYTLFQPSTPRRTVRKRVVSLQKGIRRSILRQVNVTRAGQLTPKAKKLYSILKCYSVNMAEKQRRIISYKERLSNAEKLAKSHNFSNLLKYVNSSTYNFIMCQIRNQHLKTMARRYTLEEKILALSLYKGSGKGYRLLSKIFSLPSTKTIKALLQRLPFQPGMNPHIFHYLKSSVEKMKDEREKVCILMFDEMAIDNNLHYDRKNDLIIGLEDSGKERKPLIADHANVFMLKGLFKQWKQPIAYSFSSGPVKSLILKDMIKNIIKECFNIGLEVVATVCDQGANNQAAVRLLLEETKAHFIRKNVENRNFGFIIDEDDEKEIIPLFDIPHIFKGIRNNLLNKNLHFNQNGSTKIAKWIHLQQFYQLDISEPTLRICKKLTDAHILPGKINKMKVKNCTQVFSHTVGSLMKRIAGWGIKDNNNLPPEAQDTAELILFLDELFDSLNVSRYGKAQAKPFKCPVTLNSPHMQFWRRAKQVVHSMKFYSLQKESFVSTPSLKNLIFTIEGFSHLMEYLLKKKNFKFVLTAAFNQDPLENLFSYIRSHGVRHTNPSVSHFIGSFKSLIVNNYMSSHSPNSNCQKDYCEGLDNLQVFLTGEFVSGVTPLKDDSVRDIEIPKEVFLEKKTKIGRSTVVYLSGAIIKMLLKLKVFKNCEQCKNTLLRRHGTADERDDDFIDARQFERGNLVRPGNYVHFLINHSLNYLFYIIPRICQYKNNSSLLEISLNKHLQFSIINCPIHNLGEKLCKLIIRCTLFWWCRSINNILKGTDLKFQKFLALKPNANFIDPVKVLALKKYSQKRKFVKRR